MYVINSQYVHEGVEASNFNLHANLMRIALHVYGTLMWSKYSRYNLKSYRCSLREYLRLAYWRLICMRYWVQRITTPLYIHALCSGWFMADWYVISGKSCKNNFLKLIREIFSGLPPPPFFEFWKQAKISQRRISQPLRRVCVTAWFLQGESALLFSWCPSQCE